MTARELAAWLVANGGELPVCVVSPSYAVSTPVEVLSVDIAHSCRYFPDISDAIIAMGDAVLLVAGNGAK